jgi:general secretion pathway protein F
MPRFRYRAVAADGGISEDVIDAPDRNAAIARLRQADCLPVSVTAAEDAPDKVTAPPRAVLSIASLGKGAPSRTARIRFTRELETLVAAEVAVDRALEVLLQTTSDTNLAGVAGTMRRRVREGLGLADAMAEHPGFFSPFFCATVRAGEAGGHLAEALDSLARYQERMGVLVTTVQSALIYPALLMAASLVSLVVLLAYVVPQFEQLFREAAADLPVSTSIVIAVSRFVVDFGWLVMALLVALWLYLRLGWRRGAFGLRADRAILNLPFIGAIVRRVETERFARALGALLRNGVVLTDALALTADVAGNRVIALAARRAVERVKAGATLAAALELDAVLPPIAIELVRVGEEGGRLPDMLDRVAASHAVEAETALRRFVALLEPLLIVFIGVVVGAIILSLVSAIVGINALAF